MNSHLNKLYKTIWWLPETSVEKSCFQIVYHRERWRLLAGSWIRASLDSTRHQWFRSQKLHHLLFCHFFLFWAQIILPMKTRRDCYRLCSVTFQHKILPLPSILLEALVSSTINHFNLASKLRFHLAFALWSSTNRRPMLAMGWKVFWLSGLAIAEVMELGRRFWHGMRA